ncbi:MAG: DNA mismatch repair protein MutS [Acidobacteria bacterium]|nr:DNA mismatch repair protein MutS [Acidobacteriota bacterium]
MPDITDPVRFHREQLAARRARAARLDSRHLWLSRGRIALVLALLVLGGAAWQGWFSGWWLAIPAALFAALAVVHDRVLAALRVANRGADWHELGLARLEDRWVGRGEAGERFRDPDHPYALDLDIFGNGSLFQLLATAQTMAGEETLARWLLGGTDAATVQRRQAAVRDLAARPLFHEDLFALGSDVRDGVDSTQLVAWATTPPQLPVRFLRPAAGVLAAAVVGATAAAAAGLLSWGAPLGLAVFNAIGGMLFGRPVARVLHAAAVPSRELDVFAALAARVQREQFESESLQQIAAGLAAGVNDPVRAARRLSRPVQMHEWQHNLIFAPIAAVLLWGVQCAAAVEAWRARHGAAVEPWLAGMGEIEALGALATYSFGRPDDPFPELVEGAAPVYEGEGLAHPLLPRATAVANDVTLGGEPQLLVVSGSNMSGKTTLLRTVGVNAVLALAGSVVCARRLRLTPLVIGGTLRVQDSLLDGRSRFYAEIMRLRRLVDMARGPAPLLFLLDELFHGTNSRDRVEGAHGVLRFFIGLRAVGLVTTHDLALAGLADRLAPAAVNMHFEDQFAAGEMTFDYRLRPGRATGTNALALMAAVGLDVSG